jgi:hypothetical protein
MNKLTTFFTILATAMFAFSQNEASKFSQDLNAIKSLAGIYKVSFDFAETFAPDTAYKFQSRYSEWGIEYVFVAEESDNKVVLQHLLVVNDTIIVKHWRQDWLFENKDIYSYYKDKNWLRKTLTEKEVKGTWTQKVYQVDDSPRYQAFGTWLHVDGRHFWEATTDAPLPRREHTKRSDYNVMRRHMRIELLNDGWVYDQDNEKIIRENGIDKLLCSEKGIEKFTKGKYDATPAQKWWEAQQIYWADVRKAWDAAYAKNKDLKLQTKIDGKQLHDHLFALGNKSCKEKNYVGGSASSEISKTINNYILK